MAKQMAKLCECHFCERYHRIEAVKVSGDVAAMAAIIDELHEDVCNAEEDAEYRKAILDGIWPNAHGILKRALQRCWPGED